MSGVGAEEGAGAAADWLIAPAEAVIVAWTAAETVAGILGVGSASLGGLGGLVDAEGCVLLQAIKTVTTMAATNVMKSTFDGAERISLPPGVGFML